MALTAAQTTAAVKLGVAAFGAPISTYTTVFEAVLNSAAPFGGSIENTYTAFLTLVPPYENVTDAAFAATFVETLLGDSVTAEAKAAGVTLVETLLASPGATRGSVAVAVIDALAGVPNDDATFGAASARLENRVVVAEYYTTTYGGTETDVAVLQTIIAGVTATTDVSAPASIIDGVLNPVTNFTLTTGVDVLSAAATDVALKTGAGADKISGVVSTLSSEGTLNATDSIDGDAGNDTLALDLKAAFSGFTGTGGVKNVETIALTNTGTIDRSFSTKGITGATTYNLKATGAAVNLTDLAAAGGTVNVEGQTKGALSVGFTAAALAGTADALTLGLNNVGTVEVKDAAGAVTTAQQAVAVSTTAGLETLAVMATGANVVSLAGSAAGKITVAGAGSLKVTAANAAVTSFDASAATGAVTADLTAVVAAGQLTAVKGGSGDDSFTVDSASLAANVVLAGGAGANSLSIKGGAGGVLQPTMTGFQTLGLAGGLTGALTISGKNAEGFNTLSLSVADALNGNNVTIANLTSSEFTVKSTGAQAAATVTLTPAAALTYTTAASATATAAKTAETVDTDIKATEATSATINVGAYTSYTGQVDVVKAATVTLNVASGKNAAGTTEVTSFGGTLNADAATSLVVNATGALAASTLQAKNAGSVELTATAGSTGAVIVDAVKATQVNITAGDALNLTGSNFGGAEQVTIAANKGALTGGVNLGKVNTLTLSGAASNSAVTLGLLGAAAQEYAVNVTASGLKGGLTLGAISSKAAVSLDLNAVTGIAATGVITGDTVTVNAANALNTVTVGTGVGDGAAADIVAKSSVTYNGTELKANALDVLAGTDSTALTAVLNGGIDNDTFYVKGTSTTTSLKVSGALNIGATDSVTVDATGAVLGVLVAPATMRTVTIDASGVTSSATASSTTILGATAANIKNAITGSALNDTITGGAEIDTINGGAGNDTITGGLGGDLINGGAGNDLLKVAVLDTAVAVNFAAAAATAAFSASQTTVGMDVVTAFAAGDTVQLSSGAVIATGTTLLTGATANLGADTAGDVVLLRGTYNASTNAFVGSLSGADSMLVYDTNGTTAAGTYEGIVLVGYVDTGATDTISAAGLFTAVA